MKYFHFKTAISYVGPMLSIICLSSSLEQGILKKLLRCIKSDIKRSHRYCVAMDIVIDTTSELPQDTTAWLDSDLLETVLLINLNVSPNDDQYLLVYRRNYSSRFRRPCSLVLYDMSAFLKGERIATSERGEWPENVAVLTPSPLTQTFFLFHTLTGQWDLDLSEVSGFANSTAKIQHSVFAVLHKEQLVLLKAFPQLPAADLIVVAQYSNIHGSFLPEPTALYPDLLDFYGAPSLTLTCINCHPDPVLYEKTGVISEIFYGPIFSVLHRFNATFEVEEVFGVPGDGILEDGSLDGFILPLVEGTAVLSAVLKGSAEISKVVYLSHPYLHDRVKFITGLPKRKKIKSLQALRSPFNHDLRLAVGISAVSMAIVLGIASKSHRHRGSPVARLWTVLRSMVDQPSFATHCNPFEKDPVVRKAMGAWLLGLIVLGSVYKSLLTSMITIPKYTVPPRTFQELVESPGYQIGAVLYSTSIENDLKSSNNTISRAIQNRVFEYDYLQPDCYTLVLENDAVCLGYTEIFKVIGQAFTTDIRGRKMYMESKEARYSSTACIGISKSFPMFAAVIDWYVHLWQSSDLNHITYFYQDVRDRQRAQKYALQQAEMQSIYTGVSSAGQERDASDAERIVKLVLTLLAAGMSLAAVVFLAEVTFKNLGKIRDRAVYVKYRGLTCD